MVQERAPNAEGVGEVKTGHGGELVDIVSSDPDGFGFGLSDRVVEAKLFGQKTRWHGGEEGEDEEGGKVA